MIRFSRQHGGHALALVAGGLFPLGLAPVSQPLLIIASCALLAWLLRGLAPAIAFRRAFAYGMGFWGVGASWVHVSIHVYGGTSLPFSLLLTTLFVSGLSLFHALQGWTYATLRLEQAEWLTFPALWVLWEWVRIWCLSGFPWLFAGYGFIDTPLAGLAPLTGVLGVSAAAVLGATTLLALITASSRPRKLMATALMTACLALATWSGKHAWTFDDTNATLRVALVQGNIPQELKWDPAQKNHIMNTYISLSEPLWGETDVVIWPEAAFPMFHAEAMPFITALDARARESGTAFVSGIPYWESREGETSPRFFNSIFAAGQGGGLYHKQTLVPFGEYVPLEGMLRGLLPFFDLPMSSFSPGSDGQKPLQAKNFSLGPFICYEIVYPEVVRHMSNRADVLLTISNDAWFGHSFGPLQHFEMARMRALELGRYLIRATNTGVTAIVGPDGKVLAQFPQFEQGVLQGEVHRRAGHTPLARTGYWPLLAACVLAIVTVIAFRLRRGVNP
jgi:apolipoprotein N-acyltransferase